MVSHTARSRSRLDKAADSAGRFVNSLLRGAPGVLGAAAVCVGVGMMYRPAALLVAGVFLLLVDRRQ